MDKIVGFINRAGWGVIEVQEAHPFNANRWITDPGVAQERDQPISTGRSTKALGVDLSNFWHWCESRANEIVGYTGSTWLGPLAYYLKDVTGCSSIFVMSGCVMIDSECFRPPFWFDYVEEELEETGALSVRGRDIIEILENYARSFSVVSSSQEHR